MTVYTERSGVQNEEKRTKLRIPVGIVKYSMAINIYYSRVLLNGKTLCSLSL